MREGDVQRHFERLPLHFRDQRQNEREKPLHVGRAARMKAAVAFGQSERIARPLLPRDGNHIGVARQQHAAPIGWADCRIEIGLALAGAAARMRNPVAFEIIGDPIDQREVGARRGRVERHQPVEDLNRRGETLLGSPVCGLGVRRARSSCRPASRSSTAPRGATGDRCGRRQACGSSPC